MTEEMSQYTPLGANPFLTGSPVRGTKMFFGRKDDFREVRQRLLAEEDGIVLLLMGARRSGKTSIMFQIMEGALGDEFLSVFVDMQLLVGMAGDGEFFHSMARQTLDSIRDERLVADYYNFDRGNPILTFDRLLEDVQQIHGDKRLLFLIDEAELLQKNVRDGNLRGEVLAYLASILESRKISFCFTGSPGLSSTEGEEWRRLAAKGSNLEIGFLSLRDCSDLIEQPVEGLVQYEDGVVEAIFKLTFGHPYYTQYICSFAFDHLKQIERNTLTMDDLDEVVRTIIDNPPPQLVYQWDELDDGQRIALSLMSEVCEAAETEVTAEDLIQAIKDNKYPLKNLRVDDLHSSLETLYIDKWLERTANDTYVFRVDIFPQWVRRARSIWRLVGEAEKSEIEFPLWKGIAAAVLLVAAVGSWLIWGGESGQVSPAASVPQTILTTGEIWLESNLRDVEVTVWIDGEDQGVMTLPTILSSIDRGEHTIKVQHSKYRVWESKMEVIAGKRLQRNALMERLTGFLSVVAEPDGAQIQIDGEKDTTIQGSFDHLELWTGPYTVEVRKQGHIKKESEIEILADSTSLLQFLLEENVGQIFVDSRPRGAGIYLDDVNMEKNTPALLTDVPASRSHKLRLELVDYLERDTTSMVLRGRTDSIKVELGLKPATVTLISLPPGAEIFINDPEELWGTTPVNNKKIAPGEYNFRVFYPGYKEENRIITLKPDEQFTDTFELEAYTGQLRLPLMGANIVDVQTNEIVKRVRRGGEFKLKVGDYRVEPNNGMESKVVTVKLDTVTYLMIRDGKFEVRFREGD